MLRDLGAYAARLAKQPIGSIPGAVTFVLAIISGGLGHTVALPAWAWGLLAEGGLVLASFLDWRVSRRMSDEHARWLKEIAASVHDSVQAEKQAAYVAGGRADEHVRTAFQEHFTEFVPLLAEWDQLPAQLRSAREGLHRTIRQSWGERWSGRPGWHSRVALDTCINWVDRNLPQPSDPPRSPAEQPPFAWTGHAVVSGNPGGGVVIFGVSPPWWWGLG